MNEAQRIAGGTWLLAEVRGDGFAALDNFLLRDWQTRLNRWLDYLPGTWGAKLPAVGTGNASALVAIQAPTWSRNAEPTVGEVRRMLSDLVAGVDVVQLTITGATPATNGQIATATQEAAKRSPLALITGAAETVVAWVVVGLVVAVVLSRDKGGVK